MKKIPFFQTLRTNLLPLLILILIIIAAIPGMAQSGGDSKSSFNFSSGKFTNETLGMTIKAPAGWSIFPISFLLQNLSAYSRNEIKNLEEMKKGLDKKKDAKKIKEIDKSIKDLKESLKDQEGAKAKSEGYIFLFKAAPTEGSRTCLISAKAIGLDTLDEIKTGEAYLKILQPPAAKKDKPFKTTKIEIDGIEFDSTETRVDIKDEKTKKSETVTYRTYAAPVKGYMVVINSTATPQDEKLVSKFINAVRFKK